MGSRTFYIDENGHTGDLLQPGSHYDFAGQPHFVLAAIGSAAMAQTTALLGDVVARRFIGKRRCRQPRDPKALHPFRHIRPGAIR